MNTPSRKLFAQCCVSNARPCANFAQGGKSFAQPRADFAQDRKWLAQACAKPTQDRKPFAQDKNLLFNLVTFLHRQESHLFYFRFYKARTFLR